MADCKIRRARRMRRELATDCERRVWLALRDRRFGAKFRRQQPLGRYIADFICFEPRLVIELDGGQHAESADDVARDAWFRSQGFAVLRFWNNDVVENLDGVLATIAEALSRLPPLPSWERGQG